MDFYTACPEPEHLRGREFNGTTFRDYTGVAEPWQHVDWLGALGDPSAITDRVDTGTAAPFQVHWLSLHVSNFAGLQSGDTYRVVLDTTPPLVLGEPTATVLNYTTIEVPSYMSSPVPSPACPHTFTCAFIKAFANAFMIATSMFHLCLPRLPPPPPSRRNSAKLPKTNFLGAALLEECHAKWNDNYTANAAE